MVSVSNTVGLFETLDGNRIGVKFPYDTNIIPSLKAIAGHQSLKTTEIYTHVSITDIANIKSPLDFLQKDELFNENPKVIKLLNNQNHKE